MKPYTKMMLLTQGTREPEPRGAQPESNRPSYRNYPAEGGLDGWERSYHDPENRRRRYKNGRFAPSGSMSGDYPANGYRMNDDGDRMIGFDSGSYGPQMHSDAGHRDELAERRNRMGGSSDLGQHMDKRTAMEWVRGMEHADGSRGEHWTYEQCLQLMRQCGAECSPAEFYACMNMMWSDYGPVIQSINQDTVEFWCRMVKAFLADPDAVPGKLLVYYESIAK